MQAYKSNIDGECWKYMKNREEDEEKTQKFTANASLSAEAI